jgi:hypothetical protein
MRFKHPVSRMLEDGFETEALLSSYLWSRSTRSCILQPTAFERFLMPMKQKRKGKSKSLENCDNGSDIGYIRPFRTGTRMNGQGSHPELVNHAGFGAFVWIDRDPNARYVTEIPVPKSQVHAGAHVL